MKNTFCMIENAQQLQSRIIMDGAPAWMITGQGQERGSYRTIEV